MTVAHLNGHQRTTLASLFRHPAAHNVEWHDVLSLLQHLGGVTERHDGDFDVVIGAHAIILDRPEGHDLDGGQLRSLRHFLAAAGLSPDKDAPATPIPAPTAADAMTCIVLVDHHHAKIFAACHPHTAARAPIVVKPADDDGSHRRVTHRQGDDDHDGGHPSEEAAYYERITADLGPATRIVATDRVDFSQLSDGEIVEAGLALVPA